ncbi:uncharacterized protein [Apostichopus japonicus]|uniref:uncharacterized protein n=1 Tax=Stichopus japonicus TaxID=307972 RepID=UPI003AB4BA72
MDRNRRQTRNISRQPTRSNQSTPVRAEPSTQQALTLEEKKEIFLAELKSTYKERYDAIQPIPYIKDRLYCVDKVFVEGSIEGFISTDESWERLASYNHIFTDPRIKSVRRIIEGEPGYGKSTLTLQLAYDWCNGVKESPFFDADVLILLLLRQLGNVKSIYRAIKMFLLPNEPRVKQSDIRAILEGCHRVKVLLDGYDEYPERDQTTGSDIDQIVRLDKFQKFEVNLTTRYLPKHYDKSETKRVKLKGFDETARDRYIRKAITGDDNEKAFDKIKQGLKGNPILDDLCQVPLFFVTFAHMTDEREDFQKFKSVTEFFNYMMKCFHSHARNKARERNVMTYEVEFESTHVELDKIAFEGLNREYQHIVWGKDAFCKRVGQAFYDHYIRVGILVEEKVVDISDGESPGDSINTTIEVSFYHKLFCEWFASFRVADIAAGVNNSAELEQILGKMDPLDLQYVFRFACGLSRLAARNIIEYLKKKQDCDKFATLCILEQNGDIEEIRKTVTELCAEAVIIRRDDSKLLQRSTVQLLHIASSHDIPISYLILEWSFLKVDNTTVILRSDIALPSLSSLESLVVNAGNEKPELTEEDIAGLLNYVLPSKKFRTLWFTNYTLPTYIRPEKIPEELKRKNVQVLWPSNACYLDLQSGRWKKADDVQTITELCSQTISISYKNSVSVQRSAIELLVKASSCNIPISWVTLGRSFSEIDEDGNIILSSGLTLPIITSIERMLIQTEKGREMNEHEVNGILNYLQHSQRLKELQFQYCLLSSHTSMHGLFNLLSKNVKVFWYPYGPSKGYYILNLQSGRWKLTSGCSILFPTKSIEDELTEAEYRQEVDKFRHFYRAYPWQQTLRVSRGKRNLHAE